MYEQVVIEEDAQAIDRKEPFEIEIAIQISKKRVRTEKRNKNVECNVCLRKMRSDHLKRYMLKHRELYTLDDDDDIHDEIKRRKKLLETKEDHEQLVRQIAAEEGLQPEHCDIDTADVLNPISVKKQLIDDGLIYTRKIE